jgi:leucyl aminopeptidase
VALGESVVLLIGGEQSTRDFVAAAVRAASSSAPLVIDLKGKGQEVLAAAEAALLATKTPTSYKSEQKVEDIDVQLLVDDASMSIEEASVIAHEVIRAREVINMPANDLYPEVLAEKARLFAEGLPVNIEVWDESRLEKESCGGILGVGKGSTRPPRLVKIEYRGGGKHIGLAGKGITFDTGGLSLKPAEGMVGMKYDMAGAATILAATLAAARLRLKVDITAILCLAENMPSGSATRPGDVIKIRNGKTVEVLNTDAEGRLVLADGLSLLTEMKPDHIVDVATLTGAASIALGRRHSGLMGMGEVVDLIKQSASQTEELI